MTLAIGWVVSLLGDQQALRVEEVEWDDSHWHITLGWYDPEGSPDYKPIEQSALDALAFRFQPKVLPSGRIYKTIKIDDESRQVLGMKIREL